MIYAFTDIHGRYDLLVAAFDHIHSIDDNPRIIGLGDYIDRGPQSAECVEFLIKSKIECLTGNHEVMFVNSFDSIQESAFWMSNGGYATKNSYAAKAHMIGRHRDWMKSLPTKIETDYNIFVHAGLNPDKSIGEQSKEDMTWIRQKFLNSNHDFGKHVVHGHTPKNEVELRHNRTNLDIGASFSNRMAIGVFNETKKGPISIIEIKKIDNGFEIIRKDKNPNGFWNF